MNTTDVSKSFLVKTEQLEFDRHNPRLVEVEGLETATDKVIMAALVAEADIGELVASIVANTYMDIEPLIVTQKGTQQIGNYRVLEGNRRLSAIRFIQNPALARDCRLSIPKYISDDVLDSLKKVTAYLVDDEEEARAFIGFKHINGPHRWDSYAKARFISGWYLKEIDNGITIEDIASKLGDNNQTVRSLIAGMLVLKQAEDEELFQITDRSKRGPFGFSHLYTALGRIEYRDFLGLKKEWKQQPLPYPVPSSHSEKLKEVLQYLYGSKKDGVQSVIKSQNPDLKHLGQVIANPIARNVLLITRDLEVAREEVGDASDIFQDALIIAHTRVQEVMKKISKFSPNQGNLLTIAIEMAENANNIHTLMKMKVSKNKGQ
jgi:hypothetical protein